MKKNKTLTPEELQAKIANHEDFMLVDVLGSADYHHAHINGATNIPLAELEAKGPQWLNRNIDIIIYSANGTCHGAEFAQDLLGKMGYRVWTLEGGVDQWIKSQFPVEGDPNYKPQPIDTRPANWSQPKPTQATPAATHAPQGGQPKSGQSQTGAKIIPFPQKGAGQKPAQGQPGQKPTQGQAGVAEQPKKKSG